MSVLDLEEFMLFCCFWEGSCVFGDGEGWGMCVARRCLLEEYISLKHFLIGNFSERRSSASKLFTLSGELLDCGRGDTVNA